MLEAAEEGRRNQFRITVQLNGFERGGGLED
jgi:hypothetical protein